LIVLLGLAAFARVAEGSAFEDEHVGVVEES